MSGLYADPQSDQRVSRGDSLSAVEDTGTDIARAVTDAEVEFFCANGWVMIPRLLDREFALDLRERGRRMIGEDAEGKRPVDDGAPKGIAATKDGGYVEFFEKHDLPSRQDDTILGVARSRQIGQNAARLLGRDSSIKILYDQFAIKRQQSIGGKATDPHQDGVVLPFDRPSVGFWIALGDLVPEQGAHELPQWFFDARAARPPRIRERGGTRARVAPGQEVSP